MYQPIYTDLKNDPRAGKKKQKSTERRKTHTHTNMQKYIHMLDTHVSRVLCW